MRSRKDAATSAVRSVEPSSTTSTSVLRLEALTYAAINSSELGRRSSSLKEGTMMESCNDEAWLPSGGFVIDSRRALCQTVFFPGTSVQYFLDLREREVAFFVLIIKMR